MCGFLFCLSSDGWNNLETDELRTASKRIASRGNTDSGELFLPRLRAFHYRLAFRDLQAGQQPMADAKQSQVLVFNGELYRFRDLRRKLNYSFTTDSDTEVIFAALATGQTKLISDFDGEFAFAFWNADSRELYAARDPYGIKPLFVALPGASAELLQSLRTKKHNYDLHLPPGQIHLASEIKGLPIDLRWETKGALRQFFSLYEEIATPFQSVIQIPPGGILRLRLEVDGTWRGQISRFTLRERRPHSPSKIDYRDVQANLKESIARSVESRLDADVPLGSYLSGGIDSRIVVNQMLKAGYSHSSFTVGFEDSAYDEVVEVQKFLANHDGITAHLLRTTNKALDYAYRHAIYSSEIIQPYTNGAAKWWLSRFARRQVRGVLTGDGSDEIFCGYPSYKYVHWWQYFLRDPNANRRLAFQAWLGAPAKDPWSAGQSSNSDGSDLERSTKQLDWPHPLYWQIESLAQIFMGTKEGNSWLTSLKAELGSYLDQDSSPLCQWQNYFLRTHFPTHVLNWVGDRMEMANTLEGRPPFLSAEVWDIVKNVPDHYLVRGFTDKAILRSAFRSELGALAATPKKQFNAPFLFNELLGREYLTQENIERVGVVSWDAVERAKKITIEEMNPMRQSYANIFLQNTLVVQLLDEFLVRKNAPVRDLDYEERFLDQNSEVLQ